MFPLEIESHGSCCGMMESDGIISRIRSKKVFLTSNEVNGRLLKIYLEDEESELSRASFISMYSTPHYFLGPALENRVTGIGLWNVDGHSTGSPNNRVKIISIKKSPSPGLE